MLSNLPTDRVVKIHQGMTKLQIENAYLESFMDRDVSQLKDAQKTADLREKRASLKVKIRKEKNIDKIKLLEVELDALNKEIATL